MEHANALIFSKNRGCVRLTNMYTQMPDGKLAVAAVIISILYSYKVDAVVTYCRLCYNLNVNKL